MDTDVRTSFSLYLADRFHNRFGAAADCQIHAWHEGETARPPLATGGSGLNAMIEFRPNEAAWAAEFTKLSRRYWCQRLSDVPSMERLADTCHFIAWDISTLTHVGALLAFFSQACAPGVMEHQRDARANSRPHSMFVNALLHRQAGASDQGFREYLRFVTPLIEHVPVGSPDPEFRVLWVHLWDGSLRGYWMDGFAGLSGLGEWLGKEA